MMDFLDGGDHYAFCPICGKREDWCECYRDKENEMEKYCCEAMQGAIESWGGVWWDEEKHAWFIEDERGGDVYIREIKTCPWCEKELTPPRWKDE